MLVLCLIINWFQWQSVFGINNNLNNNNHCDDAYPCSNDNLAFINDTLLCQGYHSCDGSNISLTNNYLYYGGSMSCTNTDYLIADGYTCYGLMSCAHNNNLNTDNYGDTTDEHIRCRGELSCANTNMLDSNSNYLWCYGDRSCINTTESNISTVVAAGYLSLANSVINIDSYRFHGSGGGNNSIIICDNRSGGNDNDDATIKKIYCYNDACSHLTISDTCDMDKIEIDCDHAQRSSFCNDTFGYDLEYTINVIKEINWNPFDTILNSSDNDISNVIQIFAPN